MVTPILTTKLNIPSLRRNLVPRHRLVERLNQGLHRRLALVSAPAGFGKTTLLGEWIHALEAGDSSAVKVAWLSLDEGDNDPVRFSAYLTAALQRAHESIGRADGDVLQEVRFPLRESHLVELINRVAALPQAYVLMLDDYHLITSQVVHDAVAFIVDHLPENLHLVIATRADPPLPLPRLRARGDLIELRQSDLRFTADETAAFLNQIVGLNLSVEDVTALEARTEGWIAGLQMAALSLRGQPAHPATRAEFVQAFTGSHRFILDYLIEEVLEQQPPALQEFLLKTSMLERLCASLCDSVLGKQTARALAHPDPLQTAGLEIAESQVTLEHLEAANLFIIPLDEERQWYRYHRLFSDLLRKRLGETAPDLVPALHRRASAWHEQQGLMTAAIHHALAAEDLERAGALIESSVEATLMRSEVATFLGWVEKLPDDWVRARPSLCFFHAWALMMSGRSLDAVERRLQDAASVQDSTECSDVLTGRMAALRAYLALFRADMHDATELSRQALEDLPESDRLLRSVTAWILSIAELANGDLQDGSQALREVARLGQETGNPLIAVIALCYQATLQMRQGRLHQAREILEHALHLATDPQGQRLPIASEALIGLGRLWREWNDLETAARCLAEGIKLAKQWSDLAAFDGYMPLARIRQAQGDAQAAREALEAARQIALRSKITELDDLLSDLQQAHFAVLQGDVEAATRWAETRGLVPSHSPTSHPGLDEGQDLINAHLRKYEHLILARLFLLQGRSAEALDVLEPLSAQARQLGRVDLAIEIQILRALALRAEGQETGAMAALSDALSLAEPGGYLRIFLDEGQALQSLVAGFRSWIAEPALEINSQERNRLLRHADRLLDAFSSSGPGGVSRPTPRPLSKIRRLESRLVEPLSERELDVLRLLAVGLSNPEIADELYIAVSTVRSHCKSIYGKLNVHKRWDAVQRGQELGLIP